MSSTITSADLDRAKVASFDRGYREGFEAARAGHPFGTTALDVMNAKRSGGAVPGASTQPQSSSPHAGAPAPKQAGAALWDDVVAQLNAGLPAHARIPGKESR